MQRINNVANEVFWAFLLVILVVTISSNKERVVVAPFRHKRRVYLYFMEDE